MDFESAQKWLEGFISNENAVKMKYDGFDLQRVRELADAYVGKIDAKIVLVAGSKGKGTVCALISEYLHREGYNVGRYTSPHIVNICERFWLDGADASEEVFAQMVADMKKFFDAGSWKNFTLFEILTVMALKTFKNCDYLVLEVGLGGRLDATNIVNPSVSVLMRVELEHVGILGNTLGEILSEKMGICRPGVPLVVGEQSEEVLEMVDRDYVYGGDNLGVVCEVVKILLGRVDEEILKKVFLDTHLIGRFDVRGNVIFDMAHTVESMRIFLSKLKEKFTDKKFIFLLSFMKDKNVEGMMKLIRPMSDRIYFADSHETRGIPAKNLGEVGDFDELKNDLKENEMLVVTGSHFLVGKILRQV